MISAGFKSRFTRECDLCSITALCSCSKVRIKGDTYSFTEQIFKDRKSSKVNPKRSETSSVWRNHVRLTVVIVKLLHVLVFFFSQKPIQQLFMLAFLIQNSVLHMEACK